MKKRNSSSNSIELYPTFTCQIKLEYGKVSDDGNRQVHLVIETAKGVIFLKGFRVDKHFTDVLMPMLPLGKFSSPYYLAGISPEIRKDILDALQQEEGKNAENAIHA
jgi:hypothetical protein